MTTTGGTKNEWRKARRVHKVLYTLKNSTPNDIFYVDSVSNAVKIKLDDFVTLAAMMNSNNSKPLCHNPQVCGWPVSIFLASEVKAYLKVTQKQNIQYNVNLKSLPNPADVFSYCG